MSRRLVTDGEQVFVLHPRDGRIEAIVNTREVVGEPGTETIGRDNWPDFGAIAMGRLWLSTFSGLAEFTDDHRDGVYVTDEALLGVPEDAITSASITALASDERAVWASLSDEPFPAEGQGPLNIIARVDARTARVIARDRPTARVADMVVAGERLVLLVGGQFGPLAVDTSPARIEVRRQDNGSLIATGRPLPEVDEFDRLSLGANGVWLTSTSEEIVRLIDPDTGKVRESLPAGCRPIVAVEAPDGVVTACGDRDAIRLLPRDGGPGNEVPLDDSPVDAVIAAEALWVVMEKGSVWRWQLADLPFPEPAR